MKLWITIIISFFVQEIVSMNAVILSAYEQNYNMWIVMLLFVIETIIITFAGYGIGVLVQKKFKHSRLVRFGEKQSKKFEETFGTKGSKVTLVLLGIINFNYINAFVASWLSLSFVESMIYLLIGDLIWFVADLLVVLGVNTFIPPAYAMYFMVGISLLLLAVLAVVNKKVLKNIKGDVRV